MKSNLKERALAWIRGEADDTTKKLLAVLSAGEASEYEDVPREVMKAIHNLALFNLLKIVNFPESVLGDELYKEEHFEAYDEFANRQSRKLAVFCDALTRWQPAKQEEQPRKKRIIKRRKRRKQVEPEESGNSPAPEAPDAEGRGNEEEGIEIPGFVMT